MLLDDFGAQWVRISLVKAAQGFRATVRRWAAWRSGGAAEQTGGARVSRRERTSLGTARRGHVSARRPRLNAAQ